MAEAIGGGALVCIHISMAEEARQGHEDEAVRHTEARGLIKVRIVDFLIQYVG